MPVRSKHQGFTKLTQKDFADETNVSRAAINTYEKMSTLPPTSFLLTLRAKYNIDLNKFTSSQFSAEDMTEAYDSTLSENAETADVEKYTGVYALYYFDTTTKGDQHASNNQEPIHRGILVIQARNNKSFNALAALNICEATQKKLFFSISSFIHSTEESMTSKSNRIRRSFALENASGVYEGFVTFTHDNIFIQLSLSTLDRGQIILHRPRSEQPKYIGGLGTMNSVTHGSTRDPCVQLVGLSSYWLDVSSEELGRCLLTGSFQPDMHQEADELTSVIHDLYISQTQIGQKLSAEQKRKIIESLIEDYVTKAINANEFRLGKVSRAQDNAWYHMIKAYRRDNE